MKSILKPIAISLGLLAIAIGTFSFLVFRADSHEDKSDFTAIADNFNESEMTEKWAEGTINRDGHHYIYNSNLKNYLIMGIDKDGKVKDADSYIDGGQSDAMFILSIDVIDNNTNIVSINRNTITEIELFDADGTALGKSNTQICLQHGFGDGKRLSCNYSKNAVSRLFYELPIDGYLSINVGAVPMINAFVGGVEVEVLPGVDFLGQADLSEGNVVTLSDKQAYEYLRKRDVDEYASANDRLARQEQYIEAFLPKFSRKINEDANAALILYGQIEDYIVTDLQIEDLLGDIASCKFNSDHIYTVPGTIQMGDDGFEEYIVNEDEFYNMILNVFYQQLD